MISIGKECQVKKNDRLKKSVRGIRFPKNIEEICSMHINSVGIKNLGESESYAVEIDINRVANLKKWKAFIALSAIFIIFGGTFLFLYQRQEQHWQSAKAEDTFEFYANYYIAYPNGRYANEAKTLITDKYNTFIDRRDKQKYKVVVIGKHIWMAENLNYKTTNSVGGGAFQGLGRIYAYMDACKVCPSGWRLPKDNEWTALINFLGGLDLAGPKLQVGGISGFNALMAGNFDTDSGHLSGRNYYAFFWGYQNDTYGMGISLESESSKLKIWKNLKKQNGSSVRCIKN